MTPSPRQPARHSDGRDHDDRHNGCFLCGLAWALGGEAVAVIVIYALWCVAHGLVL